MDIWVIGSLNQLFSRGFYSRIKFSKRKQKQQLVRGKNPLFVISPFGTPCSICLNIGL